MKINTDASYLYNKQRAQTPSGSNDTPASFSSALTAVTGESVAGKRMDFTSLTRQELSAWMNDQIRSGKMSLDESSAFLGMTMKISVATGLSADMATDSARIDFTEKARLGIEEALSRNDLALAKRLQAAIRIMHGAQDPGSGVDVRA